MSYLQTNLYYTNVAAAYGTEAYGCGSYDTDESCTVQDSSPLAPLTGFMAQPTYVVLPTLLIIAVLIGTVSFLITRKLRAGRGSK